MTTKFDVGKFVFLIEENKVQQFEITLIKISGTKPENIIYTLHKGGIKGHTERLENQLFKTKEELIQTL